MSDVGGHVGLLDAVSPHLAWIAAGLEVGAIAVLTIGAVRFGVMFATAEFSGDRVQRNGRIDAARVELGRYILAGLEVLIVSDVIHTALSLDLRDLAFLAGLVAVRTLISVFLTRELAELDQRGKDDGPGK